MKIFTHDNPLRRIIGRGVYGVGYWLLHGRSAWDEPVSTHYSFVSSEITPQQAAAEAARLERAVARGDSRKFTFGDRHKPTTDVREYVRRLSQKAHP